MLPKPKHLGLEYACQFKDQSIADAYQHRPFYPDGVFSILLEIITAQPRKVLDVGAGTGDVARPLSKLVERVDAVDFSEAMLEKGRTLPGGDNSRLNWIYGSVEEAPLNPPYGLITAGESLHWMEWEIVFPRFQKILAPGGYLAIVGRSEVASSWSGELLKLIQQFTTNKDYQPYNVVDEIEKRGLFEKVGEKQTEMIDFSQTIDSYVESIHSRNGFSRNRMSAQQAARFDTKARKLLSSFATEGKLNLKIIGTVTWGIPKKL